MENEELLFLLYRCFQELREYAPVSAVSCDVYIPPKNKAARLRREADEHERRLKLYKDLQTTIEKEVGEPRTEKHRAMNDRWLNEHGIYSKGKQ